MTSALRVTGTSILPSVMGTQRLQGDKGIVGVEMFLREPSDSRVGGACKRTGVTNDLGMNSSRKLKRRLTGSLSVTQKGRRPDAAQGWAQYLKGVGVAKRDSQVVASTGREKR